MTANRILQMNGTATALTAIAMLAARSILYPLFGLESPLLVDATAVGFLAVQSAVARAVHVHVLDSGDVRSAS
jgi:hypothetical protein